MCVSKLFRSMQSLTRVPLSFVLMLLLSQKTDTLKGHVSEKTDAFAMGILIVELLISEAYDLNDPLLNSNTFCIEAREMVDEEDSFEALAAAIEAKSVHCAGSCWASSAVAKRSAKILIEVAIKCVKGAKGRSTPVQVLSSLERADAGARMATADSLDEGIDGPVAVQSSRRRADFSTS